MQRERGGASPGAPVAEVKAVVVGDGGCGKTSLLVAFARGDFPKVYVPTVFEKYTASLQVGGKPVKIHLWDTAGQEDYDRLRPLSYSDTNVVLICFDVTSPNTFDNILTKGEAMARQVHAVSYLECSARYQENVGDIFAVACSAALGAARRSQRRRRPRRGCVLS
ncbi:hypothetical protein Q9233_008879 [Columba guinea]|nr:hypothetical protein Q9233_008879 [Columba guinea]